MEFHGLLVRTGAARQILVGKVALTTDVDFVCNGDLRRTEAEVRPVHQGRRRAVSHVEGDLRGAETGIYRNDDESRLPAREHCLDELRAVLHPEDHPIAGLQAEPGQPQGQGIYPVVQFAVRPLPPVKITAIRSG